MPEYREPPMCSCGHSAADHETQTEVARFSGLFNPALAGRVETYVWVVCTAIDGTPEDGEPCQAIEHAWGDTPTKTNA